MESAGIKMLCEMKSYVFRMDVYKSGSSTVVRKLKHVLKLSCMVV